MKNNNSGKNFTDEWLPIKNINNGMIETDDGYYVTGVKVQPLNIFILDEGRRDSILNGVENFYNTIDYEFWILIADRPVDIDVYLAKLQVSYNQANDAATKKLIMQDINKANEFRSTFNVVDTEYFILFKEKKMDLVQKKLHNIMSGLANAGLNSMQTSNNDLRVLIDNFLNDGETTNFGVVM